MPLSATTNTLKEPRSYFDSLLAFFTFDPVRLDVVEANPDTWTQPGVFVSNGAYVMVEHNPGENLVLEKNEFYWDADNVPIERIEVAIIDEDATALAAFEAGELDYADDLPAEDMPRVSGFPEFVRLPRPGTWYVGVNTTAEHVSDVTFRKALAKAIDKDTIVNNVLEMPWRLPADGVIPPEIFGHQGDAVGFAYDPDGAVAMLEEYMAAAGIDDAGDIVIELWYNKGNEDVLDAVQAMWEGTLGIDVRIVTIEWASYLDILDECNN
jgi:oligopeptide transport system substrate-binding protein